MMQIVLIGLGAGAASALLFASVASGSLLSLLLFYLAPLPILIAALGWSHWAGLCRRVAARDRPRRRRSASYSSRLPGRHRRCRPGGSAISRCWRGPPAPTARRSSNGIRSAASCCGPRSSARVVVIVALLQLRHRRGELPAGLRRASSAPFGLQAQLPASRRMPPAADIERLLDILVAIAAAGGGRARDPHQCLQSVARRPHRANVRPAAAALARSRRH